MTGFKDERGGDLNKPKGSLDPQQAKMAADMTLGATANFLHKGGEQRVASHITQVSQAARRQLATGTTPSQLARPLGKMAAQANNFVTSGKQQELLERLSNRNTASKFGKGAVDALSHVAPRTVANASNVTNDNVVKGAAGLATAASGALVTAVGGTGATAAAVTTTAVAAASAAAPFVLAAGGAYALYRLLKDS